MDDATARTPSATMELNGSGERGSRVPRVKLGEELPVFCEKCGYSLHGAVQVRCQHCDILQFHCPECGHHQPINTLRPAAQRILGRMRAAALVWAVFWRLNFFGWLLFAWGGMGAEWSYRYDYAQADQWQTAHGSGRVSQGGRIQYPVPPTSFFVPRKLDLELTLAFSLFALPFGMVGRMLLLRWRRSWPVGGALALLVVAAMLLGARFGQFDRNAMESPFTTDLAELACYTAGVVCLGAIIVWPIWVGLVRLFLPAHVAASVLAWQRWENEPVALART